MNPYYQDDSITLYLGDCRDILPKLDGKYFVFTDPPYNVGKNYDGWNDSMPLEEYFQFCATWIGMCKNLSNEMCIYPPKKHLLRYWNMLGEDYQQIILPWKPEGLLRAGFIDQFASMLTNATAKVRTKTVWEGMQMRGLGYFFKENHYGHPGYTSEDITSKVINNLAGEVSVLDPFGGTGTTARVCKNMGVKCVTIEYSEKWCEFMVMQRLRQTSLFEHV